MSEQSTSAKLRRSIVHRLPRFLQSRLTLSVAERAAVDLASSPAQFKVGSTSTTTFAIPLVGAHQVSDWDVINTALRISLQALIAQSDPNWRAVICSQTRPDAIDLDPRISFLPFEREVEGHDKVAKLQCLADHCLRNAPLPGFFMPLDGDDLLHRDLVARLGSDPQSGALFDGGVILNSGTGELGRTRARSLSELGQKPFWKFCGSCMVLPVGRDFVKEHRFFHVHFAPQEQVAPRAPPILDRLPFNKRGSLVALSVEDHYVRIQTVKGEEMVLMRLGDAIREVGDTDGAQVHRSHWVAWTQVTSAKRKGDRAILTMATGQEIPASRANLAKIKEAGLLP